MISAFVTATKNLKNVMEVKKEMSNMYYEIAIRRLLDSLALS